MDVIIWAELVRRAGGRSRAERAVREGLWWRVLRAAYAPVEHPDDSRTRAVALRLVLPPHAVPSHRTALWLHGLDVLGRELEVTAPRGHHLVARPGLRTSSAALPDSDVVLLGGAPVSSAARAVVDIARTTSLLEAVAVGDAVLRSGAAEVADVQAVIESSAGLRGVRAARAVVPHLEPRSESLMESRLRMRLVFGGVPRPEAQLDVYDADGHVGRVDLHLDGVVLEYDGRESRLDPGVFVAERRRQTRLAETGLEIRRFTSADCYVRPAGAVCGEVLRAVAQAAGRDRSRVVTGPDTLRPPRLRRLPTIAEQRAIRRPAT